jgi:hypothetical protein
MNNGKISIQIKILGKREEQEEETTHHVNLISDFALILVRFRMRILGSVPLTNVSGSGTLVKSHKEEIKGILLFFA